MSHQVHSPAPVYELAAEPVPYYLADGDGRAHLLLGQVGGALARTEETAGAMSVILARTGERGYNLASVLHTPLAQVYAEAQATPAALARTTGSYGPR